MGATWEMVSLSSGQPKVCSPTGLPSELSRLASDQSMATAKVCTTPISSEATKAPASEPMPPTTTTTKMMEPTDMAMAGSVT